MVHLLNYTPHAVNVIGGDNGAPDHLIPSSGIARVSVEERPFPTEILWFPGNFCHSVKTEVMGDVEGLPEATPDTWYIVSRIVAAALPGRSDLIVPTGFIRDDEGNIIGCTHFVKV
jgi:hypothetical protein